MGMLRWLINLVIIVGYFAAVTLLGSWLMAAAPIALALLVIVITIVRVRIGEP